MRALILSPAAFLLSVSEGEEQQKRGPPGKGGQHATSALGLSDGGCGRARWRARMEGALYIPSFGVLRLGLRAPNPASSISMQMRQQGARAKTAGQNVTVSSITPPPKNLAGLD